MLFDACIISDNNMVFHI